jgi:pimeloyl-ACP methyl ester carboxylesterase
MITWSRSRLCPTRVTPDTMERVHHGIAGSEWVVLEESSHTCHLEEETQTLELVRDFLARVERGNT